MLQNPIRLTKNLLLRQSPRGGGIINIGSISAHMSRLGAASG
jgi:hypothetical protein